MITSFIYSFQSEWLKTRHSLASFLVFFGGFFIPTLMTISRLLRPEVIEKQSASPVFWEKIFNNNWQTMSMFLLPMGVVLATSLITQLEFRNNTWKQTHTTPQYFSLIFTSKLAVILAMLIQFFVFFTIGIYLSGAIPAWVLGNVDYPTAAFPWHYYFEKSALFFIDSLPIVALQYIISLQFKNFLVPLSIGIGLTIGSLMSLMWKHGIWVPYTYASYHFNFLTGYMQPIAGKPDIHLLALIYTFIFIVIGYILYIYKKEKG
jgi:lantibiotic transport system permease protein